MPKDIIPNFLLSKPSRRFNPYAHWKTYKDRDILFQSDERIERWEAHPEGIIIDINGLLSINGEKAQSERERERERESNVARPQQRIYSQERQSIFGQWSGISL